MGRFGARKGKGQMLELHYNLKKKREKLSVAIIEFCE